MTKIMEDRWKDPLESDDFHLPWELQGKMINGDNHWLPNMIEKKKSHMVYPFTLLI